MANYSAIKAAVNAYIKQNGRKEITGRILNAVLNATIDSLGRFFQFAGGAMPTDDPGTPDQNVCYLATEPGLYTHFGNIRIENEEVALLFWNGEWVKQTIAIGIQEVNASVDNQVGTPSVDVNYSQGQLVLTFHNLKGGKGDTGDPAGFGTIGADINGGVGTPGVSVETSGDNTAKNLMFHFTNLKGETGVTSVVATIDNTSGTPSCQVSLVNGVLTLAFSGLKGLKGDTGVSADYPITIYNGLDSDATDQALAAYQGKVLNGKITQLEAQVDDLDEEAVISRENADAGDLSFSDESGNVIVKFADGHIETKNFNSKNIRELIDTADSSQFYIVDKNGNVILEVINGHIKTKYFDSSIGIKRFGNFSILGDSWSAMKGYIKPSTNSFWYPSSDPSAQGYGYDNDVETPEQMWWYIFANQYGIRLIQNNSWSGSRIANSSTNPQSSFLNRMDDLGDVPELVLVFGTRNDDNNTQLGNYKYSDWTESDLETYRPAVAKLLDTLLKTYIGATILFVCNSANSDKKTSAETICEHYDVPFLQIDLTNEQVTGGHPNSSGMAYISNQIINKLTTL